MKIIEHRDYRHFALCGVAAASVIGAGGGSGSGDPNALNPLTFDPDLAIFTGIMFLCCCWRS